MNATAVHWIPKGFHTLTPYLHAPAGAKLIEFLKNAFGAVEDFRALRQDGTIQHAQVRIGDSIVGYADVPPDMPSPKATSLRTYVQSVDETYRRALDAGAVSSYEPVDRNYGDREAGVKDPSARCGRNVSASACGRRDLAFGTFNAELWRSVCGRDRCRRKLLVSRCARPRFPGIISMWPEFPADTLLAI